jgi:hypothetical protein
MFAEMICLKTFVTSSHRFLSFVIMKATSDFLPEFAPFFTAMAVET